MRMISVAIVMCVEIEIPRRGDENKFFLNFDFFKIVEIEIPRRGDENALQFLSLSCLYSVEIEIPRRGDENCGTPCVMVYR